MTKLSLDKKEHPKVEMVGPYTLPLRLPGNPGPHLLSRMSDRVEQILLDLHARQKRLPQDPHEDNEAVVAAYYMAEDEFTTWRALKDAVDEQIRAYTTNEVDA